MINIERVFDKRIVVPYRVSVDGKVLTNKKGQTKRFATALNALSYAQRLSEKEKRDG